MLRLLLALFFLSASAAYAEEGFLPYQSDVALSGTVFFEKHSGPAGEASYDPMLRLDKPVAIGGSPSDDESAGTFHNITVIQILPHDEHVAARLRAFDKSRVNVRGWLSGEGVLVSQRTGVLLNATEVEPVKANGSP